MNEFIGKWRQFIVEGIDEELFTPNEMGGKAIEDESNSSAFQEGKGQDLADKYVAKLRQEFKNLSDDELDEFKKTLATAFDMNESVNEAGVLDRYRSSQTPSREQYNRVHTNNELARIMDLKKKNLTPDEFKILTDELGIKLVDNSRPDSAFYEDAKKLNDSRIRAWVENLDDYEIERKIKELN